MTCYMFLFILLDCVLYSGVCVGQIIVNSSKELAFWPASEHMLAFLSLTFSNLVLFLIDLVLIGVFLTYFRAGT